MKQRQNPQIVSSPSHPIPIHIVIQQQSDDNYLINPSLVVSSSNQMVLATSSFKSSSYNNNDKFTLKDNDDTMIQKKMETYYNQYGRILGSDRKGFLDHLKFKSLFLSVSSLYSCIVV